MRRAGILAVALVGSIASFTLAAEPPTGEAGGVDSAALAQFGIPGLEPMSDAQGHEVRGGAFVFVGSLSFALGRVDPDAAISSGAPRLVSTSARRSVSFGGFSVRARSSGFAFAAAR